MDVLVANEVDNVARAVNVNDLVEKQVDLVSTNNDVVETNIQLGESMITSQHTPWLFEKIIRQLIRGVTDSALSPSMATSTSSAVWPEVMIARLCPSPGYLWQIRVGPFARTKNPVIGSPGSFPVGRTALPSALSTLPTVHDQG